MLYRFLLSKKGFTMMEILIVVIVMGILVSVAVPVFVSGLKKQRLDDCRNQCLVIQTAVQQAMFGMIDNGKRQETINIAGWADGGALVKKQHVPGDGINISDDYNYKYYTVLDKNLTLSAIRGGYRPLSDDDDKVNGLDYDEGCKQGYYLKKKKYQTNATPFYIFLDNAEIPICPFDDEKNPQHYYCIFEDGKVVCSGEECNEVE